MENKKNNKFFKKLILGIFLLFISSNIVYGGNVVFSQTDVINDRATSSLGNTISFTGLGISNDVSIGSTTGDIKFDFPALEHDTFLSFTNTQPNGTIINLVWFFENSGEAVIQELTLTELGKYYFLIEPDFEGEAGSVLIDFPDGFVTEIYMNEKVPQGMSGATEILVGAITDVIEINIGFWKLGYYIFIIGVILAGIGLLIGFGFKLVSWAEQIKAIKEKVVFHKGRK